MRLLCLLSLLLPVTVVADVLFSDSTIDLTNYTASAVYLDSGVTLQSQNCSGCGNPGGGYQETVTLPPGGGSAVFGLINNGFVYNPATEGAIASLTASADVNVTVNRPPAGGFTPVFVPLLEQGGNYYISILYGNAFQANVTTIGYQTISESGLMAGDFGQIDFQSPTNPLTATYNLYSNPDFSSAGGPIQFGFAPIVWVNDQFQIQADYANLSFDIEPTASVPEPAFLAPLALLLAGSFFSSFRRSFGVRSRGN
ncbi:MAG TPA: hypothetical protein VKV17_09945 [Bryobacteraceae bacterium]|nr:hypothetical protein [Bryobacteraceae bacterium]